MAKSKATKAPKKPTATNSEVVEQGHDPFNGHVYLKTDGKNFWAEHERKGIASEPGSQKAAKAAFDSYVNDSQFA